MYNLYQVSVATTASTLYSHSLPDALLEIHGVYFMTLPPYSPEFNPTELVFNTLTQRLKSERARYTAIDAADFKEAIEIEMGSFDLFDVVKFYKLSGYLK